MVIANNFEPSPGDRGSGDSPAKDEGRSFFREIHVKMLLIYAKSIIGYNMIYIYIYIYIEDIYLYIHILFDQLDMLQGGSQTVARSVYQ